MPTATAAWNFEADWPHRDASRYVEAAGIRWHVQHLGRGPLVMLIHGTGASTHSWEGLAEQLRGEFSFFIVDLPGHGFSESVDAREMTLSAIAGRLGMLLGKLNLTPECIIGHSAGAAIAVRMVLDRVAPPPRSIISLNGALSPLPGISRWVFPPMARLLAAAPFTARVLTWRAGRIGAVERLLTGMGGTLPHRTLDFYRRLFERPSHVQGALDMMASWDLDTLRTDLKRLDVPLDLIACGDDLAVPAEDAWRIAREVQNTEVHFVRGLGHLAHEESPEGIARVVRSIMADRVLGGTDVRSLDDRTLAGRRDGGAEALR